MAHLPQLKQFDGSLILPRDRIIARQQLPALQADLDLKVLEATARKRVEAFEPQSEGAYTVESRNEMYLELAQQKEEKDKNERRRMGTEPKEPRVVPGIYNARGGIRQCNEGKYDFLLDDTTIPGSVIFELGVPKYLDTDAMDVDVNPLYVRCVVKDKVTQLKLPSEVSPDSAKVQRSRTTGKLRIEMLRVDSGQQVVGAGARKSSAPPALEPLKPDAPKRASKPSAGQGVSIQNIYKDPKRKPEKTKPLLNEVRTSRNGDEDDDGVPPLEPLSAG